MAGKLRFHLFYFKKQLLSRSRSWPPINFLRLLTRDTLFVCVDTRDHDDEGQPHGEEEAVNPNLPIRQYLDKHIMPSLIEALEKLTQDKPEDPIQYIGEYLLREEDKMKKCWYKDRDREMISWEWSKYSNIH